MLLTQYLHSQPRGALRRLARQIGAHEPDLSRWASGDRLIPIHYGAAIEKATAGKVTRKDLFPKTWRRIWPELDQADRAHHAAQDVIESASEQDGQ